MDHGILLSILRRKIKDEKVIFLIKKILANYESKLPGKGMPLGNYTSQFFANVYLNELDYFVKHKLKATYYLRYVDDFVIFHKNKAVLEGIKVQIDTFLKEHLKLELHPQKSKTIPIEKGISFLGFRIFYAHMLPKKSNMRKAKKKLSISKKAHEEQAIDYDSIYNQLMGWLVYARKANTYTTRKKILKKFEQLFTHEIATADIERARKRNRGWQQPKKPQ